MFADFHKSLFKRPAMYVNPANYSTIVAYMEGMDFATNGGYLIGFREWLVVKLNKGYDNYAWGGLIPLLAFPDENRPWEAARQPENLDHVLGVLSDCLDEYYAAGSRSRDLTMVFVKYHQWREKRYADNLGKAKKSPAKKAKRKKTGP